MSNIKERILKFKTEVERYDDRSDLVEKIERSNQVIEQLAELIEEANQILLLTHPKLSDAEMNTLTTKQYIIWKEALAEIEAIVNEKTPSGKGAKGEPSLPNG